MGNNKGFGVSVLCGNSPETNSGFWYQLPDSCSIKRYGARTTDFRRDKLLLFSRELAAGTNSLPVWADDKSRFIGLSSDIADSLKTVRPFYSLEFSSKSSYPDEIETAKNNHIYNGIKLVDNDYLPNNFLGDDYISECSELCDGGDRAGPPIITAVPISERHDPDDRQPDEDKCTIVDWPSEKYYLLVQNAVVTDSRYLDLSNAVVDIYKADMNGDAVKPSNCRPIRYPDGPTNNMSYLHGYNGAIAPDTTSYLGHPEDFFGIDNGLKMVIKEVFVEYPCHKAVVLFFLLVKAVIGI